MDRRGLFKALIGGSAVAAVPAVAKPTPLETDKEHWCQDHSGHWWRMYWTGWKTMSNMQELACQHIAYPVTERFSKVRDLTRPCLYSSFPGGCSAFQRGDCFDIAYRSEQTAIVPDWANLNSPPQDLHEAEMWSYRRLRDYVEKVARVPWDKPPYIITRSRYEWERMIEDA